MVSQAITKSLAAMHVETEPRVLMFDTRKRDAAYVATGRWRCEASPTGAHWSVDGVCRYCGVKR